MRRHETVVALTDPSRDVQNRVGKHADGRHGYLPRSGMKEVLPIDI